MDTGCVITSHALAKELLNKPDGFLTATHGEKEFVIESYQRKATHANIDDYVIHWTLNLHESGNISR